MTALGLNILNMAIISPVVAYAFYIIGKKIMPRKTSMYLAIFLAAWGAVVLTAIACAVELGASAAISTAYGVPFGIAVPVMAVTHMFIGIGEGIVTVLVVLFIEAVRPDIILTQKDKRLPTVPVEG